MIRVLIVDDHPVVRDGMASMLGAGGGFDVRCASGGEEAISFCRVEGVPDVVVMDVKMPDMDGFTTVERIRRYFPDVKVLLLSGMPLKTDEERAREMKICGYLPKSVPWRRLVTAIEDISAGGTDFIGEAYVEEKGALSDREMEVLKWMAQGKIREEIAIIMGISVETVKTHARSIMRKLDSVNNASSVARAYELGILRA